LVPIFPATTSLHIVLIAFYIYVRYLSIGSS
jgi:hypothetical protein